MSATCWCGYFGFVESVKVKKSIVGQKGRSTLMGAVVTVGAGLAAAAALVQYRARKAERENPPTGRFVVVHGVRLHYVEQGQGEVLVLLHGNGSMIQDFATSGLVSMAAKDYRVIVFDRPGYGYSQRPGARAWTPAAQADLFDAALALLGVRDAIVLGHSWGASVAVALALRHPARVKALVLASGYYYPTFRVDVALLAGPAIPGVGTVFRYTIGPLLGELIWPAILHKLFGPAPIPARFEAFPEGMALRPTALQASAAESALMIPDALALSRHYRELTIPVIILAGEDDKVVTTARQSGRLYRELPQSRFRSLPKAGHMVHHTAPKFVLAAIDEARELAA